MVFWKELPVKQVCDAMAAATCTMCGAAGLAASSSGVEGLRPRSWETPERITSRRCVVVRAAAKGEKGDDKEEKKSLFTSLTDALDFAAVRSEKDAELLQDARQATKSGEQMSREQVSVDCGTISPHLTLSSYSYSLLRQLQVIEDLRRISDALAVAIDCFDFLHLLIALAMNLLLPQISVANKSGVEMFQCKCSPRV